MATLKATGCRVETREMTIFFSEAVDQTSAKTLTNYTVFAPNSGFVNASPTGWTPTVLPDGQTVVLTAPNPTLNPGEWVQITVAGVAPATPPGGSAIISDQVSGRVPSEAARATRDVEDAIAYPVLTEEIGYRPSPVGTPTTGGVGAGIPVTGGSNLGQVALRAVSDVLGWKPSATDPKGFLGALTQSFTLSDVEGHVESTWVPRTYAVQTDLGGGVTGAQASLYMRAKDALDQSLTLLDGLYPLDPEADPEYVKALREMARSQMSEIVKELGTVGLPSILRIDTYFEILLGQHPTRNLNKVRFDPDQIEGTLGELRDTYGIQFRGNPFNNSVEDEQDITNFRVISDYMTSLLQSWIENRQFFIVAPNKLAFFGTQLVLISRQLNVIAETVNEVRFTLDSVFIGPNERQSLLLEFRDHSLPPMFLEDMLVEIEKFVIDEGPRLLRDGGKISVTNNILPVVDTLEHLVKEAHDPENRRKIPDGYRTVRVRRSLDDLQDQLRELRRLVDQVKQNVPHPEDKLVISSITQPNGDASGPWDFTIYGNQFDPAVEYTIYSTVASGITGKPTFVSAQRIDVSVDASDWQNLQPGYHDVTVTNPDGEVATLSPAFHWDGSSATLVGSSIKKSPASNKTAKSAPAGRKDRAVVLTSEGQELAPLQDAPASTKPAPTAPGPAAPAEAAPASPPVTQEHMAAMQSQIDEMKKAHETWFQRLEDKLSDLFESNKKGEKSSDGG